MTTTQLCKRERDELLVYGALREDTNALKLEFAQDLTDVILMFYYVFDPLEIAFSMTKKWDEFDTKTVNKEMRIEGDNLLLSRPGGSSPYSFGTKVLDSATPIVIWRFVVLRPWCWRVGIVDASEVKKNLSLCHERIKFNYVIESRKRLEDIGPCKKIGCRLSSRPEQRTYNRYDVRLE